MGATGIPRTLCFSYLPNLVLNRMRKSLPFVVPFIPLERPAYRKSERAGRLKIIQSSRVLQNRLQWRQHQRIALARMQRIGQTQRLALQIEIVWIIDIGWRNQSRMQSQRVIRVIDSERSLHNGQIHDELDTRRHSQLEICTGCNGQLFLLVGQWKSGIDVGNTRGVQSQTTLLQYPVGAGIDEQ